MFGGVDGEMEMDVLLWVEVGWSWSCFVCWGFPGEGQEGQNYRNGYVLSLRS